MIRFSSADGVRLQASGVPHVKKPNPVYLHKMPIDFEVETTEGLMKGHAGGYVAYDPISGHVWAVTEDYVAQHYEKLPQ